MNIDDARKAFSRLLPIWISKQQAIETEQDTRFQVIDRMMTEVLGWNWQSDFKTESHVEGGFVDYLLVTDDRNRMVLEAKKASRLLTDTKNPLAQSYVAGGPAIRSAQDGLNQAQQYCLKTGTPLATLTTGFEWIAFWALRDEGKSPFEGKVFVFPSLQAVDSEFALFYDLFSLEGVLKQLYKLHIREAEGLSVSYMEKLRPVFDLSETYLLQKSKLATDLDHVFREFFSSMAGNDDREMLAKCFVESKESKDADASLQKITRKLINQIEVMHSDKGAELQEHIKDAMETRRGEFVLIIGNKGAGKSTFVDRFFQLSLEQVLRERCLLVRIDLADSTGDIKTIVSWLTNQLHAKLESALFGKRAPTYDELQGVFYKEYERWREGEHKFLYESDKVAFKIKFGEYISDLVENDREKYVRRLLWNAVAGRSLMPCLVFDNTDHFPQAFQETVFQFAQSIHRGIFSFVICPITDRTIWQLSKAGPLQSYETTAFYLPVPSTREVLEKRVQFIKEKIDVGGNDNEGKYFLGKGIRLSISHLKAFAAAIEEIFLHNDQLSRIIGWLANHDLRRSLQISQRIITSPIISVDDLVKSYIAGNSFNIKNRIVMRAALLGDYNNFNQESSDFILNVYTVQPDRVTSPLTKLSIIRLLMDIGNAAKEVEKSYVSVDSIQSFFEPMGFSRPTINQHLEELLKYRLVEPYDPTDQNIYEEQRIRIAPCGRIHFEFATQNETYVTLVGLATPLRDSPSIDNARSLLRKKKSRQDWLELIKIFTEYCLQQDNAFVVCPGSKSYEGEVALRVELRNRWIENTGSLIPNAPTGS